VVPSRGGDERRDHLVQTFALERIELELLQPALRPFRVFNAPSAAYRALKHLSFDQIVRDFAGEQSISQHTLLRV
jgi:hypothetical protein